MINAEAGQQTNLCVLTVLVLWCNLTLSMNKKYNQDILLIKKIASYFLYKQIYNGRKSQYLGVFHFYLRCNFLVQIERHICDVLRNMHKKNINILLLGPFASIIVESSTPVALRANPYTCLYKRHKTKKQKQNRK